VKTVTVELEDDEVLFAVKRPESYEDVHPDLLGHDAFKDWAEWRVMEESK